MHNTSYITRVSRSIASPLGGVYNAATCDVRRAACDGRRATCNVRRAACNFWLQRGGYIAATFSTVPSEITRGKKRMSPSNFRI